MVMMVGELVMFIVLGKWFSVFFVYCYEVLCESFELVIVVLCNSFSVVMEQIVMLILLQQCKFGVWVVVVLDFILFDIVVFVLVVKVDLKFEDLCWQLLVVFKIGLVEKICDLVNL